MIARIEKDETFSFLFDEFPSNRPDYFESEDDGEGGSDDGEGGSDDGEGGSGGESSDGGLKGGSSSDCKVSDDGSVGDVSEDDSIEILEAPPKKKTKN